MRTEVKISTGCMSVGYLMAMCATVFIVERLFSLTFGLLSGELLIAVAVLVRGIYEAIKRDDPRLLYTGLTLLLLGIWVTGTLLTHDSLVSFAFLGLATGIGWTILGVVMYLQGR